MTLDTLIYARDDCIATCPEPAPCSCSANESCVQIGRSCHACPAPQCIPNSNPAKSSKGVSSGAVAGAVVAAIIALAAAGFFVWWFRRRNSRNKAAAQKEEPKEAPARAEDVLNRPDPNEKSDVDQNSIRAHSTVSYTGTNPNALYIMGQAIGSPLHSPARDSVQSNPFGDSHSIQTTSTGTQGPNVIPIALVPHGSIHSSASPQPSSQYNPLRPDRTPELDLNLDHVNVSREGTRANTPQSQASGAGTEVSNRNSYLSSMSYASDFLNEVPVIVNTKRQVLGVVKAEVMQSPSASSSTDSLKLPASARTAARSPLAGSSFGPSDVLKEEEEQDVSVRQDPFDDANERSPTAPPSPVRPSNASGISDFSALEPSLPWARGGDNSRPTSISTQAGSIIADIGSATRVQVGFRQVSPDNASPALTPVTADSSRNLHRMTSARLVSPPTRVGPLEQQQQRALISARQENRDSSASGFSTASTKADSILESFPFVPPSPISDRPVRTGPRSPSKPQFSPNPEPPSSPPSPLPAPPDRRALGMSTGSQISTMSAGLGAFPFQIDSGHQSTAAAPTSVDGRQRASLDTLALTSDLASYPLGFDKELHENYPLRKV